MGVAFWTRGICVGIALKKIHLGFDEYEVFVGEQLDPRLKAQTHTGATDYVIRDTQSL